MNHDELLKRSVIQNCGAPLGHADSSNGVVTVTWNNQGWILEAPPTPAGEPRKWLPCHHCGKIHAVNMDVVSMHCDEHYPSALA